jgi:hypothetical protein
VSDAAVKLSANERRILDCMDIGKPYFHWSFVRAGFKRGVQSRTMEYLRRLGYITITALPVTGHELDWRETGHYHSVFRKVKHYSEWSYEI